MGRHRYVRPKTDVVGRHVRPSAWRLPCRIHVGEDRHTGVAGNSKNICVVHNTSAYSGDVAEADCVSRIHTLRLHASECRRFAICHRDPAATHRTSGSRDGLTSLNSQWRQCDTKALKCFPISVPIGEFCSCPHSSRRRQQHPNVPRVYFRRVHSQSDECRRESESSMRFRHENSRRLSGSGATGCPLPPAVGPVPLPVEVRRIPAEPAYQFRDRCLWDL